MLGVNAEPPDFNLDCLATTNTSSFGFNIFTYFLDFLQIFFIGSKGLIFSFPTKTKRRHLSIVDNEIVYLRDSEEHFYPSQSYTGPIDARPPPAYVPLILSTNSMSFIILSISKFILCATTM
jgi:hypothetical protein